jgi:hypothetical protein
VTPSIDIKASCKRGDVISLRIMLYPCLFQRTRYEKPLLYIFIIYVIEFAVRRISENILLEFHYFAVKLVFVFELKLECSSVLSVAFYVRSSNPYFISSQGLRGLTHCKNY